ncbi:MAG: TetR/AcrR family transcriptional regulator [Bdellovibrio sp.]|jgi:TetR/AcrR family transcriptional regulator
MVDDTRNDKKTEKQISDRVAQETEGSILPADLESGSRDKLKDVAMRLFAERGIDGVSTRDIAKEAGVNISLISYYFGGKEGLYKTTIKEFAEAAVLELTALMDGYAAQTLDQVTYVKLMRGILTGIITFKIRSPYMSELMMREMLAGLPHMRDVYETLFNTVAVRIMNVLTMAQKKGIVHSDVNVHTLLFSMIHSMDVYFFASKCGTPFMQQSYKMPQDKELLVDQFTKIFVEGVMK